MQKARSANNANIANLVNYGKLHLSACMYPLTRKERVFPTTPIGTIIGKYILLMPSPEIKSRKLILYVFPVADQGRGGVRRAWPPRSCKNKS